MKVGKKNRNWLRAAVIASTLIGAVGPNAALAGEPIQRLGRTLGVGWGDGYHTCSDSCLRIGADLPPRSYADAHAAGAHASGPLHFTRMGHQRGTTFYDRFDADRSAGCDSCCDQLGCDTPPQTLILGSQVVRGHRLPPNTAQAVASIGTPSQSLPVPDSPVPDSPASNSGNSAARSLPVPVSPFSVRGDEMAAYRSTDGFSSVTRTMLPEKQYPLRPQAPDRVTPKSIVFPLASSRSTAGLPLPEQPPRITAEADSAPLKSPSLDSLTSPQQSSAGMAKPVPSRTPQLIYPVHPWDADTRPLSSPALNSSAPVERSPAQRPPHVGLAPTAKPADSPSNTGSTPVPRVTKHPIAGQPALVASAPTTRLMPTSTAERAVNPTASSSEAAEPNAAVENAAVDTQAERVAIAPPQTRLVISDPIASPTSQPSVNSLSSSPSSNPLATNASATKAAPATKGSTDFPTRVATLASAPAATPTSLETPAKVVEGSAESQPYVLTMKKEENRPQRPHRLGGTDGKSRRRHAKQAR